MAPVSCSTSFATESQLDLQLPDVERLSDSDDYPVGNSTPNLSLTRPVRAFLPSYRQNQIYSARQLEEGRLWPSTKSSFETLVEKTTHKSKPRPRLPKSPALDDVEPVSLPDKKASRPYRYLRWNFGSVYRRIFTLAFLGNIAALAVLLTRNVIGGPGLTYQGASTAVSTNLLVAMLVRNEHIVNAIFTVFGTWPKRLPLTARHLFAKVYSYGGIHSGCSVAATFWYITFLVLSTMEYTNSGVSLLRGYTLLFGYMIALLLVLMVVFAHPFMRERIHNWFEGVHRYMGWSIVLLFWVQIFLLVADTAVTTHVHYGMALVATPSFWIIICITLLVIYPWTHLRLREVEAEPLSNHCVKLNFKYADVEYGQTVRLTDAPLRETHAFAVIPNPPAPPPPQPRVLCSRCRRCSVSSSDSEGAMTAEKEPIKTQGLSNAGKKGFSVVVSRAGDWTQRMIDHPPTKIYTRGLPQFGVLRVAGLFEPCLIIATGSGIGPCLSLFVQKPDHPVRIIWSTPNPVETYGQAVIDTILRADPSALIIDTKQTGRPDLVKIAYGVWKKNGCEAAVIISNKKVTNKVVYGLESRGVRIYGAIFDS